MQQTAALANRPPTVRSGITNRSRLLRTDGRSAGMRRFRDLVESFTAELGGEAKLSEAEKALVKQAAALVVRSEALQVEIVNGAPINDEQLIRLANVAARLLTKLGIKRRQKDAVPDIKTYAAAKRAERTGQ